MNTQTITTITPIKLNQTKARILTAQQVRSMLDDYFMGDEYEKFIYETPKEQYTAHDVLTWLGL